MDVMLQEPDGAHYGSQLSGATGLKSGTLYPILARLERAGWATSDWEVDAPAQLGRPRRRHYKLTGEGATAAQRHLSQLPGRRYGAFVPRPAWGAVWC